MSSRRKPKGKPRRDEDGPHLVAGPRAVFELLSHAPSRVRSLWIDRRREGGDLHELAKNADIKVEVVDSGALARRAPDLDCQGILAQALPPAWRDFEDLVDLAAEPSTGGRRILVALDGVQDPQNLGAIMRSCEFFGAVGLVWPRDRAAGVTPSVVRASAGASERLPLARVVNLARALETCRDRGWWVLGTVVDGGQPLPRLIAQDAIADPIVLVMGGEHGGLRRLTRARCDLLATIVGRGALGSLNVSAATAAALALLVGDPSEEGEHGRQTTDGQAD